MKILNTNWINILGVFISVLFYSIIYNLTVEDDVTTNFFQSIFAAILLVLSYGLMFWIGSILALIVLDLILIIPNQSNLKLKLLIEWIVISAPFVYWATIYEEQRVLYIIAIITFLITQLVRERLITKATY
ncbi:hypothetical protein [Chryseobacterium sp. ISL-6]|uniref:hypothetical protein n=1 Tax=Chryseobacterium sp. ISL-6 TaxID=2819143 RepID=UPI001BEC1EFB|nr:hypothetical protein [Chryseobacterium sp. ISL-6]MBT2622615.1 hypothetical protein [Chryseobacterium sp. ISL-6]